MTFELYKSLHILGAFAVVAAMAGPIFHVIEGGGKEGSRARKIAGITHGVGLLLLLVAGFGALARLGFSTLPGWVVAKLGIWVIFGGMTAVVWRKPALAKVIWFVSILLAATASTLAVWKPF